MAIELCGKTPYQWLLQNSFSKGMLKHNIDLLAAEGIIDEGDAYDYFRDMAPLMIDNIDYGC